MWWDKAVWHIKAWFQEGIGLAGFGLSFIALAFAIWGSGCVVQTIATILFLLGIVCISVSIIMVRRKAILPIDLAVKSSKVVWGLWFTGDGHRGRGLLEENGSIRKILVLAPNSQGFKENLSISAGYERDAKEQIKAITREAKGKKIEIKWYEEFQRNGITLYEPQEEERA